MKLFRICACAAAVAGAVPFIRSKEALSEVEDISHCHQQDLRLKKLKEFVTEKCRVEMQRSGCPGLVIAVSIDGKRVYSGGIGFADIENTVQCTSSTVMRIASISKSMTMAAVAKAYEDGKIDLDKSIIEYLPSFPAKTYKGKEVTITTRHLVSHLGGIRHYDKVKEKEEKEKVEGKKREDDEFEKKEYYIKDEFKSVEDALELFKHDELYHEPGSKYLYTTHGWTLVSAVLEKAVGKDFKKIMGHLFHDLGLKNTRFDENAPIIMNRSRYYVRDKHGKLTNAPYVDNSYKWAGGGFVSTVGDLVQFGNALLYSYQRKETDSNLNRMLPGFLKRETMEMLWSPVIKTGGDRFYGMGWSVLPEKKEIAFGDERRFYVSHTGGAVGASSVLLILPSPNGQECPRGVVVAVITNMQNVHLSSLAHEIAIEADKLYHKNRPEPHRHFSPNHERRREQYYLRDL